MHIQLTPLNTQKMLIASQKLDRSVGDLVNMIVAAIEEVEISEKLCITAKESPQLPLPKQKRQVRKQAVWRTAL
ncbi:MAG: hypothetical protein AB1428_13050 [Bacteroidota bacterium]